MAENLFVKKNILQDLLSSLNAVISTNERHWIITGHVIFKLCYNQIYQLKTTNEGYWDFFTLTGLDHVPNWPIQTPVQLWLTVFLAEQAKLWEIQKIQKLQLVDVAKLCRTEIDSILNM